MVIIGVLALAVGIALLARPSRGLCIGAAILMAVNLAGAGPNEIANLTANSLGHQLFGAASLLTIVGALGASVVAAVSFPRGGAS